MRTSRSRGFRRRCAGPSLVRTRPWFVHDTVPPVTPFAGTIYRFFKPTFISDYESISTHSWTQDLGVTQTVQKFTSSGPSGTVFIMDPIRWVVYSPSAAGQRYDHFDQVISGTDTGFRTLPLNETSDGLVASGKHTLLNTVLPVSGNSHHTFGTSVTVNVLQLVNRTVLVSGSNSTLSLYRYRFRINGTGGTLKTPPGGWDGTDTVTLSPGDTFEVDLWFKIERTASTGSSVHHTVETIVQGTVTDALRGAAVPSQVTFSSISSYGWDPAVNSYSLSFTGGDFLTMTSAAFFDNYATWVYEGNGPAGPTIGVYDLTLRWGDEIAYLEVSSRNTFEISWYVPADSGDYYLSTTYPGLFGTNLWKMGCFDWDGTTNFDQAYVRTTNRTNQGKRSGVFSGSITYFPTAISVSFV